MFSVLYSLFYYVYGAVLVVTFFGYFGFVVYFVGDALASATKFETIKYYFVMYRAMLIFWLSMWVITFAIYALLPIPFLFNFSRGY